MKESRFYEQVNSGNRFEFGKNWESFLDSLTDQQIRIAKKTLVEMTRLKKFEGIHFLDAGCGSGLYSLAARSLGAKVHSFDFDPFSVKSTHSFREKSNYDSTTWTIEEGSILDVDFLKNLPKFHIVYSWGVLHHTGNMKLALKNISIPLKENGLLFISIYNDQGRRSRHWLRVKRVYNKSSIGRLLISTTFIVLFVLNRLIIDAIQLNNPIKRYKNYYQRRGMSILHDWIDWLGGFPYEVATPEFIVDYYQNNGFTLKKIITTNSLGCNQYVFEKRN